MTVNEITDHLRSALDSLVYELSVKGGGEQSANGTPSPIARKSTDYHRLQRKGRRRRSYRDVCLDGMSDHCKAEIDKLQPYEPIGRRELLALLHLSNRSKYRTGLRVRMRIVTPRTPSLSKVATFIESFEKGFEGGNVKIEAVRPGIIS